MSSSKRKLCLAHAHLPVADIFQASNKHSMFSEGTNQVNLVTHYLTSQVKKGQDLEKDSSTTLDLGEWIP